MARVAEVPPAFLLEVPEAGAGFWEAFHTLSLARTVGGGMTAVPNPIAYGEMVTYARTRGMDPDETVQIVQQLDAVWRLDAMKQAKKRTKKQPTRDGRAPRRRSLGVSLEMAEADHG